MLGAPLLRRAAAGVAAPGAPRASHACVRPVRRSCLRVRAFKPTDEGKPSDSEAKGEKVDQPLVRRIESNLQSSGMDKAAAQAVLKRWQESTGHEVTPEALRRILTGQSTKALGLVLFSTVLDAASAYAAFTAGNYFTLARDQFGWLGVVASAGSFLLAGYFLTGVAFDLFKLGAVATAGIQFRVNSAAFLAAIEDIAGASGSGLKVADKGLEAVNAVKVVQALGRMADLLREQAKGGAGSSSSSGGAGELLADLGGFLTLDRAQRLRGFDAADYGMSEGEAAEMASAFARYDLNDDGTLSFDEFRKLCERFAPELASEGEVKAALGMLDTNADGSLDLKEFASFWQKQAKAP